MSWVEAARGDLIHALLRTTMGSPADTASPTATLTSTCAQINRCVGCASEPGVASMASGAEEAVGGLFFDFGPFRTASGSFAAMASS